MRKDRSRVIADQICIFLFLCCIVLFVSNNWSSSNAGRYRSTRETTPSSPPCADEEYLRKKSNELEKQIQEKLSQNRLVQSYTQPEKQVKVLCFVKTQPKNHATKCRAIKETWGSRCDKLLFFSSANDPTIPTINVLPPLTNDSRNQLTQKVFSGLKYIFARYINDYDWFHEADDDTYIIMENLRHFLYRKNPRDPMYFGHKFMKYAKQGYTSGGAAYVMSQEALRRLITRGEYEPECNRKGSASDAHVGRCLENVGVVLGSSVDSLGRSRYHTFDVELHMLGIFTDWYVNFTSTAQGGYADYMADYPITFHYVDPKRMYTMDLLLFRTRVHGQTKEPFVYE